MAAKKRSGDNWAVQVVAYQTPPGQPMIGADGLPTGPPKLVDVEKLLDGLAVFADRAGQRLNALDVTPSSFTIGGEIALEASAGLGFTIGVSTGINVSMTWNFEQTWSGPRDRRRTDPQPPGL